jgi:hypothetical protein
MRILYLNPGPFPDYQSDMLALGLRSLLGSDLIDSPRLDHLYADYPSPFLLYGRGFTLYGLLPDLPVDRSSIADKLADHYFDLVVFSSIQRDQRLLHVAASHYRRHEILLIDGEDQQQGLYNLCPLGLYFKRELRDPHPGVHPIHFAIPAAKIGTQRGVPKCRVRSLIDPRDRSTYIYQRESDYYRDYASSLFAITMRKGGWDSLRTYEIMANACIPLFLDLDQCPDSTCMQLPKPELREALSLMDYDGRYWETDTGKSIWTSLHRRIHLKFACHSTTERLAQYVLDTQQQEALRAT